MDKLILSQPSTASTRSAIWRVLGQKTTMAKVLRKFCKFDPSDEIAVLVAMDNTLDESEKYTIQTRVTCTESGL